MYVRDMDYDPGCANIHEIQIPRKCVCAPNLNRIPDFQNVMNTIPVQGTDIFSEGLSLTFRFWYVLRQLDDSKSDKLEEIQILRSHLLYRWRTLNPERDRPIPKLPMRVIKSCIPHLPRPFQKMTVRKGRLEIIPKIQKCMLRGQSALFFRLYMGTIFLSDDKCRLEKKITCTSIK